MNVFILSFMSCSLLWPIVGRAELYTYAAGTAVRVALLLAGFHVAEGTGTGPKATTTVAYTQPTKPGGAADSPKLLGAEWLTRWRRSDSKYPAGLDEALRHAHAVSPAVVLAVERAAAARHAIDQANAQLLPSIHLQASYQRRSEPQPGVDDMDGLVAKVVVTVPIYSGGAGQAEVRAARHTHRALAWQAADVRAQVHSAVVQAWARLQATRAASSAIAVQVTASRKALAGIRAEQAVGQRSLLDLITTQQALLASRTSHEQNQRNLVVGCYSLLSAIGRLGPNGSDNPKAAVTPVRDFGMRPSPWTTSVKSGPK